MSIPPSPVRLPAGVRDFLPRAAARRRSIAERLLAAFEAWGYARIVTPVFECADVLERGLGADARATFDGGVVLRKLALRRRGTPMTVWIYRPPGPATARPVVLIAPAGTPLIWGASLADEPGGASERANERHPERLPWVARGYVVVAYSLDGAVDDQPDDDEIAAAVRAFLAAGAALGAIDPGPVPIDVGHVAPARWVLGAVGDARPALIAALARKDKAAVARAVMRWTAPS